jgi:hypothetical protein
MAKVAILIGFAVIEPKGQMGFLKVINNFKVYEHRDNLLTANSKLKEPTICQQGVLIFTS